MNLHLLARPVTTAALALIAAVGSLSLIVPHSAHAGDQPALEIGRTDDGLSFRLIGDAGTGPWVLQHSIDGTSWEDLLFLESGKDGTEPPAAEVVWNALPMRGAPSGLFRAVQLKEDDPVWSGYLDGRAKWRSAGIDSYRYELRWSTWIFWHGTITVINGKVASFETITSLPPLDEPPVLQTIDEWFDMIADARARGAETINVTWDPDFGFPADGFIDESTLIADEEISWMIPSLAPLR